MTEANASYFELGRGAKLIPREYWHQFVLGIDLQNEKKPFVVSEVGKASVLYTKEVSHEELVYGKWDELIGFTDCHHLISQLTNENGTVSKLPDSFVSRIKEQMEISKLLEGTWMSTYSINDIDYTSHLNNNWAEATGTSGYIQFVLNNNSGNSKNCQLKIPTIDYCGRTGHYPIYYGTFQLTFTQILIWQIETFPVMIKYNIHDNILNMELFGKRISFFKL